MSTIYAVAVGTFTSFVTGQLASRQTEEPAVSESSPTVDVPATANRGTITSLTRSNYRLMAVSI